MKPLTETRRSALIDVKLGYLLDGPELAAAAWLQREGLIEPAPPSYTNDPLAKRAFVLTDSGHAALQEARGC